MFLDDETFRSIVASTPLISIDLIIQNCKGEVLLGQRINRPAQGLWFVPGGRILKNETMDAAFRRLTGDELGRAFQRNEAHMLGAYEHFYANSVFGDSGDTLDTHYVVLAYQLVLAEGESLQPPHIQHDAYRWWPLADAQASEEVHDNTRAYLDDLR